MSCIFFYFVNLIFEKRQQEVVLSVQFHVLESLLNIQHKKCSCGGEVRLALLETLNLYSCQFLCAFYEDLCQLKPGQILAKIYIKGNGNRNKNS